jgi:hypothetical protein
LRCDVARVLNDFERFSIQIEDGVVGSLNPDFPSAFTDAFVFAGLVFAAVKLCPKVAIFGTVAIIFFDEDAVVFALDVVEHVAHGAQEIFVGVDDGAVHAELDHGL